MKNAFKFLATTGLFLLTSCGPTQKECDEVVFDSRPVKGACLDNDFKTVEELRKHRATHALKVIKIQKTCGCGIVSAQIWECGEE
ncbi:hypothetical protein HZA39_01585 [Candidatus Peregrinibacteria bacterium]|nr:hypothetical protein [Candidatus Peregrinibacteria bacterium]